VAFFNDKAETTLKRYGIKTVAMEPVRKKYGIRTLNEIEASEKTGVS
jgi:transposase-like protein